MWVKRVPLSGPAGTQGVYQLRRWVGELRRTVGFLFDRNQAVLVGALVFRFRILRCGTRPAMTRVSEFSLGSNVAC